MSSTPLSGASMAGAAANLERLGAALRAPAAARPPVTVQGGTMAQAAEAMRAFSAALHARTTPATAEEQ